MLTHREAGDAVARLMDVAGGDTGQGARVARFLLAWHDGDRWGHFPIADLFALDNAVAADIATVVAFLGRYPGAIYLNAFLDDGEIGHLVMRWRDFASESSGTA